MIKQLTIIGVGLIGGSLAKSLQAQNYCEKIVGCGRNEQTLKLAQDLGVIDVWTTDIAKAVQDASVVVIAVPVMSFAAILQQIKPHLSAQTLITDVGSVKGSVLATVQAVLGERSSQFIGGHPIAGKEKSGVAYADDGLFINKKIILTPNNNSQADIEIITKMWQATGAMVLAMSAQEHDEVLAKTSHLPHILAFGLMDYLSEQTPSVYPYAAGGFKDFSRIASSDTTMWRDICLENKTALLDSIAQYQKSLNKIKTLIQNNKGDELSQLFGQSKQDRDNWLKNFEKK